MPRPWLCLGRRRRTGAGPRCRRSAVLEVGTVYLHAEVESVKNLFLWIHFYICIRGVTFTDISVNVHIHVYADVFSFFVLLICADNAIHLCRGYHVYFSWLCIPLLTCISISMCISGSVSVSTSMFPVVFMLMLTFMLSSSSMYRSLLYMQIHIHCMFIYICMHALLLVLTGMMIFLSGVCNCMDIDGDRWTDRQIDRHTDRWTDG